MMRLRKITFPSSLVVRIHGQKLADAAAFAADAGTTFGHEPAPNCSSATARCVASDRLPGV